MKVWYNLIGFAAGSYNAAPLALPMTAGDFYSIMEYKFTHMQKIIG